ncbi:MAG: tol-pal system protein [Caulobacterales bacterium]|nr:tol-pal system protein [Caulobacterales bacterium]
MVPTLALTLGAALGAVTVGGGAALAQAQEPPAIAWDARRLERLDRNVRRLERALTQRNAAGDPVIIEADPEVVALMGRVDLMDQRLSDLEATLVRMNGETERLTIELEAAERTNRDLAGRLDALTRQVAELESANAEAAASDGSITPRSPSGSEGGDFDAAMRLVRDGARAEAAAAFELFIVTWPDSGRLNEAHYRLADLRAADDDAAGAVQDYARALVGWPATAWAPDATVKLAAALAASDRNPQACQALGEFGRRYAERASPALRARATQVNTQARCG